MTEEQFYDLQPLAIMGVSSSGKGFGVTVFKELRRVGIRALPVNPKGGMIGGQEILTALDEAQEPIKAAVIFTKDDGARAAIEECSRSGVEAVWLQGGSDTEDNRKLCDDLELETFSGTCILMRKGGFPHNLHRFLHDLFNKQK